MSVLKEISKQLDIEEYRVSLPSDEVELDLSTELEAGLITYTQGEDIDLTWVILNHISTTFENREVYVTYTAPKAQVEMKTLIKEVLEIKYFYVLCVDLGSSWHPVLKFRARVKVEPTKESEESFLARLKRVLTILEYLKMVLKVKTSQLVKILSCITSLLNSDTIVNFVVEEERLCIYTESTIFFVPCEGSLTSFSVELSKLRGISTLKASLVDEEFSISQEEDGLARFGSKIDFALDTSSEVSDKPDLKEQEAYFDSEVIKVLSKVLSKFSKDNFKGNILFSDKGFLVSGEYHITLVEAEGFTDFSENTYRLTSIQINKILKLGQDICIDSEGSIYSKGEIEYQVQMPLGDKKGFIGKNLGKLASLYSEDNIPELIINNPKLFKDFVKNAKSMDKQYDLCRIQTEKNRISLSFYKDKKDSNKFIYSDVVTPEEYVEIFLQVKHLAAISELCSESLSISFLGSSDPIKVDLDNKVKSYIQLGIVI